MQKHKLAMALIALYSTASAAEGFKLLEQSVSSLGNAYAGRGAQVTDASLVYSNPAALTALKDSQLSSGITLVHVNTDFSNASATSAQGQSVLGRTDGEISLNAPIPFFFYSQPLNEKWTLGAGLYVPYGLSSDYDSDWVGRYFADETAIEVVALQGSAGYQLNDTWSLGLGVAMNRITGTLSKYKDHSGLCELGTNINLMVGRDVYQPAYCNSHYQVEGDDYAASYSIGLFGALTAETKLGISYHSEIKFKLTGDSVITNTPITGANVAGSPNFTVLSPTLPAIDNRTGKLAVNAQLTEQSGLDLTTPASAMISVDHQVTPELSLQASIGWTGWHSFASIDIVSRDEQPTLSKSTEQAQNLNSPGYIGFIPEHWHDAWSGAVGITYQLDPAQQFKTGLAYDESPISASHRTARVPTNDRIWWTVGYGLRLDSHWSFDVAAGYMWMDRIQIQEREFNVQEQALYRSGLTANYKNDALLLGGQVNYRF